MDGPEARLRGATPGPARTERIVAGALERSRAPSRWVGLAPVAVGAGLMVLVGAASALRTTPGVTVLAGHEISVEGDGEVRTLPADPSTTLLEVTRGTGRFHVRHLHAGERFLVKAGPVTAEAVGTRFAVALGRCVRVDVSEGRVRVSAPGREETIAAGEQTSYCPEAVTAEEQTMFDALGRVRRGELKQAYDRFLDYERVFPRGAYAEEAQYYLARLAWRLGRVEEARARTREFIKRFPQGTRANELRAIIPLK